MRAPRSREIAETSRPRAPHGLDGPAFRAQLRTPDGAAGTTAAGSKGGPARPTRALSVVRRPRHGFRPAPAEWAPPESPDGLLGFVPSACALWPAWLPQRPA